MRNRFAEYYDLSDERINEIWDDSLIVFDTNVLLNLYRYNNDARDEFIKALNFTKSVFGFHIRLDWSSIDAERKLCEKCSCI